MSQSNTLLIERFPGETRAALLRGGRVWQVDHFRDCEPAALGGVYLGRVRRIDPAMNAAFVDIGLAADGFLRARDAVEAGAPGRRARIAELLHEGQALTVAVVAEGFAGKGPRLARLPERAPGEVAAGSPAQPPACLEPPLPPLARLLAGHAGTDVGRIVCNERALESELARLLADEGVADAVTLVREDGALFAAYEVDDAIAAALAPRVAAEGGAELVFEQTESLCAIDVNSSRHAGKAGRGGRDVNLAVAPEIARQLRLRAIGGAIVIDALKMPRGDDQKQVLTALRRHLKDDPAACHVLGVSNLGLIEMTRTRLGPSLAERLSEPAPGPRLRADAVAYAAIRGLLGEARRQSAGYYVLRVAPSVVAALEGAQRSALTEAAARVGAVELAGEPDWPVERWEVARGRGGAPTRARVSGVAGVTSHRRES